MLVQRYLNLYHSSGFPFLKMKKREKESSIKNLKTFERSNVDFFFKEISLLKF